MTTRRWSREHPAGPGSYRPPLVAVAVTDTTPADDMSADDGPCQTCGHKYPTWRAPDDLWNLVMGGPEAQDDPGGMLCPNCFLRRADAVAPVRGAWVVGTPVRPERVVKAEALREAAADLVATFANDGFPTPWLLDRADALDPTRSGETT